MRYLTRAAGRLIASVLLTLAGMGCVLAADQQVQVIQHTVVPGDTLWTLSKKYLGRSEEHLAVQQLNQVENARLLQPGKKLKFITPQFYPALVTAVTGVVWVMDGLEQRQLKVGEFVEAGSVLDVAEQSFVHLQFKNNIKLDISPFSSVVLRQKSATSAVPAIPQLNLQKGALEIRVPGAKTPYNKLEVQNAELTLGVRGTHFRVEQAQAVSRSELLTGFVQASEKQRVLAQVNAGEGIAFNRHTQGFVHEKMASQPRIDGVFYDSEGLHLTIITGGHSAAYKVKVYGDSQRTVPVHEFKSEKRTFVIPAEFATDKQFHLTVTSFSRHGIESYPVLYSYMQPQVKVTPLKSGLEFSFPYCDTTWRVQLAESEQFLVPAVDRMGQNVCKMQVHNLPKAQWYWRVFEGNNHDWAMDSGQAPLF